MSDDNRRQLAESALLNTDDAMVWAEEFCRIFDKHLIFASGKVKDDDPVVDTGTMVGWFAGAMVAAVNAHERKQRRDSELRTIRATQGVPDQAPEAFVEGFEDGREEER
jgi:hypothetical protein